MVYSNLHKMKKKDNEIFIINSSGISSDKINEDKFAIWSLPYNNFTGREFTFKNSVIFENIDNILVQLHNVFKENLFPDIEKYEFDKMTMPEWVYHGGVDAGIAIPKTIFEKSIQGSHSKILHRHLYLADCQYLISALQDRIMFLKSNIIEFYSNLKNHLL